MPSVALFLGGSPSPETKENTTHQAIAAFFKAEKIKSLEDDLEDTRNEVKLLRITLKDERRRRAAAEATAADYKRAMVRARAELVW